MDNNKIKSDENTKMILPEKRRKKSKSSHSNNIKKGNFVHVQQYDDSQFHIAIRQIDVVAKQILGSRKSQQDMYAVSNSVVDLESEDSIAWAVVCDGMGGMASGELASQMTSEVMSQVLKNVLPTDSIQDVLTQAVNIANEEVKKISLQQSVLTGTTLVCVVIKNDEMYYSSVGDSRIYIFRNNEFLQITRDHNYMLELMEMVKVGEITVEDAAEDPQKEALISFIGIDPLKLVDINEKPLVLQNNDIILLCSDGLTKILNDDEICEIIKENINTPSEIVDVLLREVQMGQLKNLDNTTIAVMKYYKN